METISAIAEMQELRAENDGDVQGYILESKMRKGLGCVDLPYISHPVLREFFAGSLRQFCLHEVALNREPMSSAVQASAKFV